jgi:uncharacterized protein (TIGR01777 family)
MNVLVTGATGLIGRALCRQLTADGHTVVAVSRSPENASDLNARRVEQWKPLSGPPPESALQGVDAVIHLAGEPIAARRWTDDQKKRIRDSRVVGTANLVSGIAAMTKKPQVLVSGSAVGYYGERGDEQLEESSPPGEGFLAETSEEWEAAAAAVEDHGVRCVQIRTGVVLSPEGGAMQKMLPPFKLGVGGPLGSGRQWFPWIHIKDIVGIFRHAMMTSALSGPVNGVAPEPVTNAEFTRALAAVLHRPAFLPVPEFAMRALMGEMADVLFVSQRVVPAAALASGYEFFSPLLAQTLEDLLGSKSAAKAGR